MDGPPEYTLTNHSLTKVGNTKQVIVPHEQLHNFRPLKGIPAFSGISLGLANACVCKCLCVLAFLMLAEAI